jgi:hypothetical protein
MFGETSIEIPYIISQDIEKKTMLHRITQGQKMQMWKWF